MERLLHAIPIGKNNAIHQAELAKRLGVATYTAKTMVRKARQQGLHILSDACGYWISEDDNEIAAYVNRTRKSAISRLETIKAVRSTLDTIQGQITLLETFSDAPINNDTQGGADDE